MDGAFTRGPGLPALALALTATCGCGGGHMKTVRDPSGLAPASDKATVIFVRPSGFGFAVKAALYDGDEYIGTLMAQKRIHYQADPGEHLFTVIGESADFMKATLLPGRTYYAVVVVRVGFWKARFSLVPHNGQYPPDTVDGWLARCEPVEIKEKGRNWAGKKHDRHMLLKAEYSIAWEAKPEDEKATLQPTSGF